MPRIEASEIAIAASTLFSNGYVDLRLPEGRGSTPQDPRGEVRVVSGTVSYGEGIELFSIGIHTRNGARVDNTPLQGISGRSRTGILDSLLKHRPNLKRAVFEHAKQKQKR